MRLRPTGSSATTTSPDINAVGSLFNAQAVAVVGASGTPNTLGARPLEFLMRHGFQGRVYPVNPRHRQLGGVPTVASLAEIREPVDLVVICVPAAAVLRVVEECRSVGARCAIVLSSGFGEAGEAGTALQQEVLAAARRHGIRILGPNSEGVYAAREGLALTFSPALDREPAIVRGPTGGIGIVSQSGGLGYAPMTEALRLGLDLRYVVSTGNEGDLDVIEVADYMVRHLCLRVLAMVVEGLGDPDELGTVAAGARAQDVDLVVVKLGSSAAGARGVVRHTGHYVGSESAYQAAFDKYAITRARDYGEFLDQLSILSRRQRLRGRRIGIVSSSGGAGIWLADCCEAEGLIVPELSARTQAELRSLMPAYGSPVNPVDITAQGLSREWIAPAIRTLTTSGEVDAVVVVTSLSSEGRLDRERDALRELLPTCALPVAFFSYTAPHARTARTLADLDVPWFPTPSRTARALGALAGSSTRFTAQPEEEMAIAGAAPPAGGSASP